MNKGIKTIIGILYRVIKVSWPRTIYFNFRYLSFKQAIHLPILLYNPGKIRGKGSFVLNIRKEDIKFGMIKLGLKHEDCILSKVGIAIRNDGKIEFRGSGLLGNGSSIVVEREGYLELGHNFGITGNFNLHCREKILIGNFFSCSWDVCIDDSDHHRLFDPNTMELKKISKPIVIRDCVWLCQKTMVLKGSYIPSWCTIAANSLVNSSLPPHVHTIGAQNKMEKETYGCIYAGIPAKQTKSKVIRQDLHILSHNTSFYITKYI